MRPLRPEALVRWLDDLDGVAFAARLFWTGARARLLTRTAFLFASLAIVLFVTTLGTG
ncbi:MAG: hypothetical protein ACR2QB_04695 [Gammaproteobacteria bacterium]